MYQLFSRKEELTTIARLIIDEDIKSLEVKISNGFDINKPFKYAKNIEELPITFALYGNKKEVISWLLSKSVELNNKDYPAILAASSNCSIDTMKMLLNKGAKINICNKLGTNALNQALYSNNFEIIPFLIKNGYDLKNDGTSLRQAVFDKKTKAIKLLLKYKIDVNFCKKDEVFPFNPSAVHIATMNNDFKIVKLLINNGADITKKDSLGQRPYTAAVINNNIKLINLIKSLEPNEWHNKEQKLEYFKQYKLPEDLLNILCNKNRKIKIKHEYIKFIEFNSLFNIEEINWKNNILLNLLRKVDGYDNLGFLVWYPKKNCLASLDYEHKKLIELCNIEDFLKNISTQIDKII